MTIIVINDYFECLNFFFGERYTTYVIVFALYEGGFLGLLTFLNRCPPEWHIGKKDTCPIFFIQCENRTQEQGE